MLQPTIFDICEQTNRMISPDMGGGSPIQKTFIMAYLAKIENLTTFVEIGVYRGRSLFPVAFSIYKNGGHSYGIDPYLLSEALEDDIEDNIKSSVNHFLQNTNFEQIYQELLQFRNSCEFGDSITIIRDTSEQAFKRLASEAISPRLLHIDGNHDTASVAQDYFLYTSIMPDESYIVFDDIDWPSVRKVYELAKRKYSCVFETSQFGILYKLNNSQALTKKNHRVKKKLASAYAKINQRLLRNHVDLPMIAIGVLAYNDGLRIRKTIEMLLSQIGNFRLQILVYDDCSLDKTVDQLKILQDSLISQTTELKICTSTEHLGKTRSFQILLNKLKNTGCEYFCLCFAGDYYSSPHRLEAHLVEHMHNPELALSYNKVIEVSIDHDLPAIRRNESSQDVKKRLIEENFIGPFSAAFFSGDLLHHVDQLFKTIDKVDEWMFYLYCCKYGELALVDEVSAGSNQNLRLLNSSREKDDTRISSLTTGIFPAHLNVSQVNDLSVVIVDSIFPNPRSGFTFAEYLAILEEIPGSAVMAAGAEENRLGYTQYEAINEFKSTHPKLADKVFWGLSQKPRLLYTVFLAQAYSYILPLATECEVPFAFTLYPGGGFGIDNIESDKMLKEIFESRFFSKVLVTQDLTYRYLTTNELCDPSKIEFCFGVPIPSINQINKFVRCPLKPVVERPLNICFVAHRYTPLGIDKGYDIFLEVARRLSGRLRHVKFHVVGPWNPDDAGGIEGLRENITYYGHQSIEWFDQFYRAQDILISANLNGIIYPGSFDGFPTGCATDAALRGVAVFATDPLELNNSRFKPDHEIVIIPRDPEEIAKKIIYYYNNLDSLASIGLAGALRVRELYSHSEQILPRVNFIKNILKAN